MRLVAVALLCALCASAQSITGAIRGSVVDPTDAAMANAAARLASAATGAERTTTTNDTGRFFFGSLQPGEYSLSIEASGFRKVVRTGINVSAAETVALSELGSKSGRSPIP